MNDLVFKYGNNDVRVTTDLKGEPWWVAKDVADQLGYIWDSNLLLPVPQEWKGTKRIRTLGGMQEMLILSEQGLYFFLSRSNKALALPFQKWLAGEVLPSIRKTGSYSVQEKLPQTYLEALKELVVTVEQLQIAEEKIKIDAPKVEFFEAVADSKDAIDMGTAAKVLNCGIGRNDLFQLLRDKKILMEGNIPYQTYVDREYFRTIEQKYTMPDGSTRISIKTLVYQKGLEFIRKIVIDNQGE